MNYVKSDFDIKKEKGLEILYLSTIIKKILVRISQYFQLFVILASQQQSHY